MKTIWIYIQSAIALASVSLASAQGTFENLNFEQANIVPIIGSPLYPYAVTVANALPDWTVDYGTAQQTQITYNDAALGDEPWVTLYANGYSGSPVPVIDGNFSLLLQTGEVNGVAAAASISQTGQIPSGTQSLLFDSSSPTYPSVPPEVFIGNDQLTLFPVGSGTGSDVYYTVWGGNISAWAGQTEQLTLSSPGNDFLIDDISFSPTAVIPEPDPLALIGIGGALFAAYRRFALKRQ